jgi:signal transduction histidine kinase
VSKVKQLSDWFGARPMVGDSAWAAVIGFFTMITTVGMSSTENNAGSLGQIFLWMAWGISFAVPLIWRRTHPAFACTLLLIPHLIQLVAVDYPMPGNISVLIMLYAVAAHGSVRAGRIWLGIGLVAGLAASIRWYSGVDGDEPDPITSVFNWLALTAAVIASWGLGAFNRERHATVASLRDRAEALERERDRFAQLAAEQERSRISREMHDVVAHSLSVIVVQTDGVRYALDQPGDPAQQVAAAKDALDTIGVTARNALRDTRALVGALRDGEGIEMAPQPQLDDIAQLVATTANSGLDVSLAIEGDPASHPTPSPAEQAAAYRIVQESLTNVIKHAGAGARAWVTLQHHPAGLTIRVRDNGLGDRGSDGMGHGLIGMRERVAASHGTLVARNRLDAGFEVIATLPLEPTTRPTA